MSLEEINDEIKASRLVTGNQRHYPIKDFIVTPAEMIKILEEAGA